ncbi:MAG TPA: MAC/perforin domain-containing protein [Ktedonobacteraceae bacterium]|nr:MAC/perforin domain-containing protein [Ktedonobacteraceae bacterium]
MPDSRITAIIVVNNTDYFLNQEESKVTPLGDAKWVVGKGLPTSINPHETREGLLEIPAQAKSTIHHIYSAGTFSDIEYVDILAMFYNQGYCVTNSSVNPGIHLLADVTSSPDFLKIELKENELPRQADAGDRPTTQGISALSQANAIGQGFDIFGSYNFQESAITPIFDPSKAGKQEWVYDGIPYTIPSYIQGIEGGTSTLNFEVCSTREEFQNSIAAKAKVKAQYGAFSGQMEAAYTSQFAQSTQSDFAYGIFDAPYATLSWTKETMPSYMTDLFRESVAALPSSLNDLSPFLSLFNQFGIYFVSSLKLGGSLEYYSAVDISSELSASDIDVMIKAEYKGIFENGEIDGKIKRTEEWKSYSSNRSVSIRATGGDYAFLTTLISADPNNPSQTLPTAMGNWVNSLKKNPAIVGFQLTGIWELCGEKEDLVRQAFELCGPRFRPQISITAFQVDPPIILLTGEALPLQSSNQNIYGSGYQMLVFDRTNISRQGLRLNKYFSFNKESDRQQYDFLYESIQADLASFGLFDPAYVVLLVSYNLPNNARPTTTIPSAQGMFEALGATDRYFQWWMLNSQLGGPFLEPCLYILVGIPGLGKNSGIDYYANWAFPPMPGPVNFSVNFYWQGPDERYTCGINSMPSRQDAFSSELEFYKQTEMAHTMMLNSVR